MSDRTIAWELPSINTVRQLPHDVVRVEFRVSDQFEWEPFPDVPAGALKMVLPDVNPGVMFYRVTLYDTAGAACLKPTELSKEAAYDPPGDLLSVTITDT